ncbi:uncharacterized protein JCM6883_002157 [Sporobolomyces salmoneus]|uniref:uncharacterized protein n=1 Tax=Sporobolomyces salmoneus TaxID=183962 RepID=UPI003173FB41
MSQAPTSFAISSETSSRLVSSNSSNSWSSSSSSMSPLSSSSMMTASDLPTPPSYSLFDSEMDHIFHETIDTSFLDSRPSSPTSFSLPILEPIGNNLEEERSPSKQPELRLSPACPPHLTLSLPPNQEHSSTSSPSSSSPPRQSRDAVTRRQIDVLTTILTSPNLLPTALPSLPSSSTPRARSRSPSSSSPGRAKDEVLGAKTQKSWLDALKEAENKAKLKRLASQGFARL